MTIENVNNQETASAEKPKMTVQNEMQKDVIKEAVGTGTNESGQKQQLSILGSAQPQQQIQATAQNQINKGYLDVKV